MPEVQTQAEQKPAIDVAAKIAQVQKALGFIAYGQWLVGLALIVSPFLLKQVIKDPSDTLVYIGLGLFYLAFGYAADQTKKNLGFGPLCFKMTAYTQLVFAVIGAAMLLLNNVPTYFWAIPVTSLIFGAIPYYVIQQFRKMTKGQG
ncbi:MAG: hypothetical protein ACM3MK_01580 [Chitinophagales bacterium]